MTNLMKKPPQNPDQIMIERYTQKPGFCLMLPDLYFHQLLMHKLLTEILEFKSKNTQTLASTITDTVFYYPEFLGAAKIVDQQVTLPKLLFVCFIYLVTCSSAKNGSRQSRKL